MRHYIDLLKLAFDGVVSALDKEQSMRAVGACLRLSANSAGIPRIHRHPARDPRRSREELSKRGDTRANEHGQHARVSEAERLARSKDFDFLRFRNTPRHARRIEQKEQALAFVLLGLADCQIDTSLAVVGDALFFAELFDFFNVQRDADVWNAFCLEFRN